MPDFLCPISGSTQPFWAKSAEPKGHCQSFPSMSPKAEVKAAKTQPKAKKDKATKAPKESPKTELLKKVSGWQLDAAEVQKRPATSPKVLKRPATKGKGKNSAKDEAEAEEEVEEVDSQEADIEDDKRDKLKAMAFARNVGSFPEWVQAAWNQPGNRPGKTRLINNIVQKCPQTGKFKFDLDSPVLQAALKLFDCAFVPALWHFMFLKMHGAVKLLELRIAYA